MTANLTRTSGKLTARRCGRDAHSKWRKVSRPQLFIFLLLTFRSHFANLYFSGREHFLSNSKNWKLNDTFNQKCLAISSLFEVRVSFGSKFWIFCFIFLVLRTLKSTSRFTKLLIYALESWYSSSVGCCIIAHRSCSLLDRSCWCTLSNFCFLFFFFILLFVSNQYEIRSYIYLATLTHSRNNISYATIKEKFIDRHFPNSHEWIFKKPFHNEMNFPYSSGRGYKIFKITNVKKTFAVFYSV